MSCCGGGGLSWCLGPPGRDSWGLWFYHGVMGSPEAPLFAQVCCCNLDSRRGGWLLGAVEGTRQGCSQASVALTMSGVLSL